jgi:hypothetical protein
MNLHQRVTTHSSILHHPAGRLPGNPSIFTVSEAAQRSIVRAESSGSQ